MKKFLKKYVFTAIVIPSIAVWFTACKNSQDTISPAETKVEIKKDEYFTFKDLKVRKPTGVPEAVFSDNEEKYLSFVKTYLGKINSSSRTAVELFSDIDYVPIIELIRTQRANYPEFSIEGKVLDNKSFEAIKKDFPDIKLKDDVFKNSDAIISYYNALLRFDILIKLNQVKKGAKRLNYNNFGNPRESFMASLYPMAALQVYNASFDATDYTNSTFYQGAADENDNEKNAFKHSVWNAISVRKCINVGYSKSNALDYVTLLCSAHEYDSSGNVVHNIGSAMDFHNNMIGRSYMEANTGWGAFGLRSMPSESDIVNTMYSRSSSNIQTKTTEGQILSIYDSNTSQAWYYIEAWSWNYPSYLIKII